MKRRRPCRLPETHETISFDTKGEATRLSHLVLDGAPNDVVKVGLLPE